MPNSAGDDIVATHADAAGSARVPLLVLEPLTAFLDMAGLGSGTLSATAIGDGHSNHTFLLDRDGGELVLRRPPRPPLPPSAHDVVREARIVRALAGRVRVPRVLSVCEDEAVIGSPFYVMEFLHGEVVSDSLPAVYASETDRRALSEQLVDELAAIHAIDWQYLGLLSIGRPDGYLTRQLRRFRSAWEHNKTREIPAIEVIARWLDTRRPESGPASLVHGDFRLGNAMFSATSPPKLIAVFDWEMATIGDPLADLGYLCALWTQADDPPGGLRDYLGKVTRLPGFATRDELVARYQQQSGRAVDHLRWYMVLALWKAAIFMEGNYKRAISGASDDAYMRSFGKGVVELAEQARELTLETSVA